MAFLNPIFLLGAIAAGLPVLVHLVRRTRAPRVQFPSLMFLRKIEQKTIRRRKLRNLLLLLMRCAALLLLAFAFSRPFFTGSTPVSAAGDHTSSVILVDGSYSMRYGEVFNRARQSARNMVNDAASDEHLAVVLFSKNYQVLMPLKADRAEAATVVADMQPGLDSTDYLQAIQAADAILKDAGRGQHRIYLISDFHDAGWNRAAPPVKLAPDVKLFPIDVSDAKAANLAVSEVAADPVVYAQKYEGKAVARISNFGSEDIETVIELKLNDLPVERKPLKLTAGVTQNVEFTGFNVPEGSNRATVEITGDTFALDNKFFFTIRRENQTRVLAIETASRGRSESFFLQQSLAAGENNQHALTVKTAGSVNPTELDPYRVVIVNDASGVSEGLASGLKTFVERGGGLILAAAKHTDAGDFNRLFGTIASAQLGEVVQSRGYALMSQVKTDHPIFGAFARSGRLTSTRVYGYHRATVKEGALTLAALDDGSPIVVEGSAGRGKVLLVTTTLDTAWNDLPLTPMFLPLMRQMLEYLGGREAASSYMIGQAFTTPADKDSSLPAVDSPGGKRVDDLRKNSSGEQSLDASEIGFYRLRYRDRDEFVAVNLDTKESDLTKLSVDELVASISPAPGDAAAQPAQSSHLTAEEKESRQRLWLPLLLTALALFVAEAVIARRIRVPKLI
ncbi:MAG TPA: BatA domain-containing protein [Blastocatellia bacterium]|nr:BatA domain-containing protein [Blastocatellia bacterium]